jgi:hypothetical protein
MRGKQQILWAVAIVVGLGVLGYQSSRAEERQAVAPTETKWEYKWLSRGTGNSVADANAAGKEGWELVAVTPSTPGVENWYFKRPQSSP